MHRARRTHRAGREDRPVRTSTDRGQLRRAALIAGGLGLLAGVAGSWIPSFWGDEAASVMSASRTWPELWRMLQTVDGVHGAYYAFLHVWTGLFGAGEAVAAQASAYLSISMAGLPAMLIVFAATGLLRGLQDTRTPLWVAGIGFAVNIALNYAFIYLAGWGIAGSAAGTVVAQWGMVAVYLAVVARHARRVGSGWMPHRAGLAGGAASSGWLFLRTLSLRAALLVSTWSATALGPDELAAYQVAISIYFALGFALDALAIAAQALAGGGLGAGDVAEVRAVLRRCLQWGVGSGVAIGLLVVAGAWVLPAVFTSSAEVAAMLPPALVVLGISAPLGGLVFVLDGVLIGAGDARYLAWTGLVNLAVYVPLALAAVWWTQSAGVPAAAALAWLVAAFAIGYLAARAVTLSLRARGSGWMVTGVA